VEVKLISVSKYWCTLMQYYDFHGTIFSRPCDVPRFWDGNSGKKYFIAYN
jgi:hypothetical protein